MKKIASLLIRKRADEELAHTYTRGSLFNALWMGVNALCWLAIWAVGGISLYTIEIALVVSVCIMLAVVDILTRKIPNELLLALLLIHAASLLAAGKTDSIAYNLLGAAIGFVVFLLPALFGKGAGLGDVKFAAAAGFILAAYDFLFSVLLMTLFLLIYTAYLVITRKGGLKSKVALGPFLAASLFAVMLFKAGAPQGIFGYIMAML